MAKQKALGMGLQALIASASTSAAPSSPEASGTEEVSLDLLDVNPYQPRSAFDEEALDALAESIRQLGLIQPISVCRTGDGRYRIISGERRFRAARRAGLKTIPVYVRPGEENRHMLLMALEENLQREDLDAIETALAYRRLVDEFGYTQEELSAAVSKKRSTVANFLRLLKLPPEVQFAIRRKAVSMGHARALVNVQDPGVQLQLLNEIIEKDLSVRALEERVAALDGAVKKSSSVRKKTPAAPWMQEAQHFLAGRLGTRVDVRAAGDGGRIVIGFASQDELQRILNQLQ